VCRCRYSPQAAKNNRWFATTGNDPDNTTWGVDGQFKYAGFAAWGEYLQRKTKPETGDKYQDVGFLAQASYAFKAPKLGPGAYLEVAGRYAKIDPNDLVGGDSREEIGGALSYYYNRHNLKVQADYRQVKDEAKKAGEQKANEFRLQTQFIF
jgi:phosphate-selective porin OprO/OprP